jgi:hypothetical protein
MVVTVAPVVTVVTPVSVVLRELAAEPPPRVPRARMGPRATAVTPVTVASVVVVSTGFQARLQVIAAPMGVTPVTAVTAASAVKPVPELAEPPATAATAVTRVPPATAAVVFPARWV